MAEVWALAIGAAVTAGTAVYKTQQEKKAAEKAAQAQKDSVLPQFKMPDAPQFVPLNFGRLNDDAVKADTEAFQRSEADFNQRNRPVALAERLFKDSVLKDQAGDSTLAPQIQGEIARAGLAGAGAAFGDGSGSLAPGSAAEASVARNLGLGVMQFQDRNRANRERSLSIAEQLFPRRTIGLGGEDEAKVSLANNALANSSLQQQYAAKVGLAQKNYDINAANMNNQTTQANLAAQGEAARNVALAEAAGSVLNTAATAYGKSQSSTTALAASPYTGPRLAGSTGTLSGYTTGGSAIVRKV